jgi:hypothetical protein
MVRFIVLVTGLHVPFPVVVNVKVRMILTVVALSADDGIYDALRVVAFGENVPVPVVVQVPPVAGRVTNPFSGAPAASAQIVWAGPASAVGTGVIRTFIVSDTG